MVKQVYAEMAAWNDSNHGVEINSIPLTKHSSPHQKLQRGALTQHWPSIARQGCPQMSQETDIGCGTEKGQWSFRSPKV